MSSMPVTTSLIHLAGLVALMLWGVQMVERGMMRACGADLTRWLGTALRGRARGALLGLVATLALQSSTATGLLVTSLVGRGLLGLPQGLAVMLGANVGTALVASLLAAAPDLAAFVLLAGGLLVFKRAARARVRHLARAAIGLGLVLLALALLVAAILPHRLAPEAADLMAVLSREPLPALLLAALVTWAAHSSVGVVLVIAALAGVGHFSTEAALVLVLGANLGSACNPLLAALGSRAALRVALGNLASRLLGCALALLLLPHADALLAGTSLVPAQLVLAFHLLFNVGTTLLLILPLPLVARALVRLVPDLPRPADPSQPRHLEPAGLATPATALAAALRELLRMLEVLEGMLGEARILLDEDDGQRVARVRAQDDVLDRLHDALRRYLAGLDATRLTEAERRRAIRILMAALSLEHAGDIVDQGLMRLTAKRIRYRVRLPEEERAELAWMYAHLQGQLPLAATVLITDDLGSAIRLVAGKDRFRAAEQAATERHLARLWAGPVLAAGTLQLDMMRELKRIEAHLAAIAQPILERRHLLHESRLVRTEPPPRLT